MGLCEFDGTRRLGALAVAKSVALLGALGLACASTSGCAVEQDIPSVGVRQDALASNEGMFEYAFDAPSRIEPVETAGGMSYGSIPILLTFHDTDRIGSDAPGRDLRQFRHATVTEEGPRGPIRRSYDLDDLAEIEASYYWRTDGSRPSAGICEPWRQDCSSYENLSGTAEWHALLWYRPTGDTSPGADVRLTVDVVVGSFVGPDYDIEAGDISLRNHLLVHLGEAPLPRFGGGWVYGDLHYHSQGTDNEGESAYTFRAVARAAGAMGLDFVFTTDHASNSEQMVDLDGPRWNHETPLPWNIHQTFRGLRDVNAERFRFSLDRVHDPVLGANAVVTDNRGGLLPQTLLGHGTVPQLYVGGEIDWIPEIGGGELGGDLFYGNGLRYPWSDAADIDASWYEDLAVWLSGYDLDYDAADLIEPTADASYMVRDRQAIDELRFARQHVLYLPRSETDRDGFVPSSTGTYGGATRRLSDILDQIAPHGYAFLAHPLSATGSPDSLAASAGPDTIPFSDVQMWRAFSSSAVLGLQLWNEDNRRSTDIGAGDSDELGFHRSWTAGTGGTLTYLGIEGFVEGEFELQPFTSEGEDIWEDAPAEPGLYSRLHHGTYTWDRYLRYGLSPTRTESIEWLEDGEPRRFFMAGGSDAHGDLNYRRAGYMFGTQDVSDTTLGTPRNLVSVGMARPCFDGPDEMAPPSDSDGGRTVPGDRPAASATELAPPSGSTGLAPRGGIAEELDMAPVDDTESGRSLPGTHGEAVSTELAPPDTSGGEPPEGVRYCQSQVVDALAEGRFAITDGPALRVVVDRNQNGVIDRSDTPMGGVVNLYSGEALPLLVEWATTEEFGAVDHVDLYVGSVSSTMDSMGHEGRTYAPVDHGVRRSSDPQGVISEAFPSSWGTSHYLMEDSYWLDPTRDQIEGTPGLLRIIPGSAGTTGNGFAGTAAVTLDMSLFPAGRTFGGDRYYARAFAITRPAHQAECLAADLDLEEAREDCTHITDWMTRQMCLAAFSGDPEIRRRGLCDERLAFTNPVWAMRRANPGRLGCVEDPRALDRDGDGYPDACDMSAAGGMVLR